MTFDKFMEALDRKKLPHVFLLIGPEFYFIDKAREKILSRLFTSKEDRKDGLTVIDDGTKTDINEIIQTIDTAPLFTAQNVVLIKNAPFFKARAGADDSNGKKSKDKRMDQLIEVLSNMLDTNYVIFTSLDTPDKRKKLYKSIDKNGLVLDAEALRSWQLDPWLDAKLKELGLTIDADARRYFIELVGVMPEISLTMLDNELNKVALYITSKRIDKQSLNAAMASLPEVSSFALTDAINDKNFKKVKYLLSIQMSDVKLRIAVMTLVVRHIRQLLFVQCLIKKRLSESAIAERVGIHPFIVKKIVAAATKFNTKTLEDALLELAEADYLLKTGQGGAELIERVVMKLVR